MLLKLNTDFFLAHPQEANNVGRDPHVKIAGIGHS